MKMMRHRSTAVSAPLSGRTPAPRPASAIQPANTRELWLQALRHGQGAPLVLCHDSHVITHHDAGFNPKPYPGGPPPTGRGPVASTSRYLLEAAEHVVLPVRTSARAPVPTKDPIAMAEELQAVKRELRACANERDALVGRVNQLQAQCISNDRLAQTSDAVGSGRTSRLATAPAAKSRDDKDRLVSVGSLTFVCVQPIHRSAD